MHSQSRTCAAAHRPPAASLTSPASIGHARQVPTATARLTWPTALAIGLACPLLACACALRCWHKGCGFTPAGRKTTPRGRNNGVREAIDKGRGLAR